MKDLVKMSIERLQEGAQTLKESGNWVLNR